jgi:uncharacterized membrane protein YdjX (TVP38/TMEM64 family)
VIEALITTVQAWQGTGVTGLAALALVFAVGSLLYVPRFTLYILGGLVFGLAAAPAAILGTVMGATLALVLARTALRGFVLRLVATRPGWPALIDAIDAEGWRLVMLVRIASPLPGGSVNYLFGLTNIGAFWFAAATAIGLVPPVLLFVGLGALGRIALEDLDAPWGRTMAVAAGLTVLALVIFLVRRRLRSRLALDRSPG